MKAIKTEYKTNDGLAVYDLDPQSSDLWVVAGPDGFNPKAIDSDNLPDGFRWVTADEWELIQNQQTEPRVWTCSYNGQSVDVVAATVLEAKSKAADQLSVGVRGFLDLDAIDAE